MVIKQLEGIIEDADTESKTALDELSYQKRAVYTIIQKQKRNRVARKAINFVLASVIGASVIGASVMGYLHSDYYTNAEYERNTENIELDPKNSPNENYLW